MGNNQSDFLPAKGHSSGSTQKPKCRLCSDAEVNQVKHYFPVEFRVSHFPLSFVFYNIKVLCVESKTH